MTNSRRGVVALHVLEVVLFLVGLAMTGWYTTARIAANREQASLSRELTRLAGAGGSSPVDTSATRSLLWRIDVPRIKLSVIAREGVDTRTLRGAAGHIPGTALPGERGNAGFAAHRDTFFRR